MVLVVFVGVRVVVIFVRVIVVAGDGSVVVSGLVAFVDILIAVFCGNVGSFIVAVIFCGVFVVVFVSVNVSVLFLFVVSKMNVSF